MTYSTKTLTYSVKFSNPVKKQNKSVFSQDMILPKKLQGYII